MHNISIILQGGIGNLMFQIACAYSYSLKYNKKLLLSSTNYIAYHRPFNNYLDNILKNLEFINDYNNIRFSIFNESSFNYSPIPDFKQDVIFNGYFQSDKYFKSYENEIRTLFDFQIDDKDNLFRLFKNNLTCSLHIRRGDYLNLSNHPIQDIEYYKNAISKLSENTIYLIFSDDIEWCKENFKKDLGNFIFIENNEDYEDLYFMSLCNNNIIANSTFSWWGAWLNKNPEKIVIAPKNWFGTSYENYDTKDLYCKDWIVL